MYYACGLVYVDRLAKQERGRVIECFVCSVFMSAIFDIALFFINLSSTLAHILQVVSLPQELGPVGTSKPGPILSICQADKISEYTSCLLHSRITRR